MKCTKCGFDIPRDSGACTRCGTPVLKRGLTPTRYLKEDFEEVQALTYSPGDAFGDRYRIVEEIGRGGMGKVYKAWDNELEIHVAIKMIHPELLSKPDTIARFKKEILIAREITHENVVRIYDFGEVDAIKFISMQYIDGENLAELVHSSGTLGIETAINIAKQICHGLKAAHKQEFIHRDLKPQNIMIDKKGKVYITDFGLAKSMEEQGLSASGIVMGTPQYLSPEQAMGEKADHRSDIYMLGIIMYEMMTGKELFSSETVIGYLQKHIQQKPASPSTINFLIPPFFEKIILKCLEKEKSKRYKNVDELLKDLQKEKVTTGPILFTARSRKILKRIASFLILPLIIVLVIKLWPPPSPEQPPPRDNRRSVAVIYFEDNTGDPALGHLSRTLPGYLITDLYQSRYIRLMAENQSYDILKNEGQQVGKHYSTDVLRKVAEKGEVNYVVTGNITKAGDTFIINTKIWNSLKDTFIYPGTVQGIGLESLPKMVDELTTKVKRKLLSMDELRRDFDEDIEKITTTSVEAYDYYWQGKMHYWEVRYRESNGVLEKAVEIDPDFAMAYWRMSINYGYLGIKKLEKRYLIKALGLIDRVSERERFLIRDSFYKLEDSPEKCFENCRIILKRYPDDEQLISTLGGTYRELEMWPEAEEQFRKLLTINDKNKMAYFNLAYIYFARGQYEEARVLLQKDRGMFSNFDRYYRYMAYIFLFYKYYDLALAEAERAINTRPESDRNIELKASIYHLKGDLKKAEEIYKGLIESETPGSPGRGRLMMSNLYLLKGKYERCKKEVKSGISLCEESGNDERKAEFLIFLTYLHLRLGNREAGLTAINKAGEAVTEIGFANSGIKKFALHLKGWTYLEMKKIKQAKETAGQLERLIKDTGNLNQMRLYYHLNGLICLDENNFSDAIHHFENGLSLLPYQVNELDNRAFHLAPLAGAYYKTDNFEKAYELYKEIQLLTRGRLYWGDIYVRSYYWLGKISQKRGDMKEAKAYYRQFIEHWQDADRNIIEIGDAKKQLTLLN